MTPMIDVVFQLLAFFLMTFTVLAREGDFEIKAPRLLTAVAVPRPEVDLPERVVLQADPSGALTDVIFRGKRLATTQDLAASLQLGVDCGDKGRRRGIPFEILCPERLKYDHVIQALDVIQPHAASVRLVTRAE